MFHAPLVTPELLRQLILGARKSKRLTQVQLAQLVGLSQPRFSHLELHPEQFRLDQLMQVCAVLELEISVGVRDTSARPAMTGEVW